MADIILLEIEEDIRLAASIVASRRNIIIDVYADYNTYKPYTKDTHVVISSNQEESRKYNYNYIKKPYTAHELLALISKVKR